MNKKKMYKNFVGDDRIIESVDLDLERDKDYVNQSGFSLDYDLGFNPNNLGLPSGSLPSPTTTSTSTSGALSFCSDPENAKKYPLLCAGGSQDRIDTAIQLAQQNDKERKGQGVGKVAGGFLAGFGKGFGLTNEPQKQTATQDDDEDISRGSTSLDEPNWVLIGIIAAIGVSVIAFAINAKKGNPAMVVPPSPAQ